MIKIFRSADARLAECEELAKPAETRRVQFVWVNPDTKTPLHEIEIDPEIGEVTREGALFGEGEPEVLPVTASGQSEPNQQDDGEDAPTATELHEALAAQGLVRDRAKPSLDPVLEDLRKSGRYWPGGRIL